MATSVHEVLSFHKIDRGIYERVRSISQFQNIARNVTVLWMWLELIGINIVGYLRDCRNNSVIQRFATEAEAMLNSLQEDVQPPAEHCMAIPITDSFVVEPLNLRFFYFNRDVVARGLNNFLDGVGRLIFDDNLNQSFRAFEVAVRAAEDEARRLPPQGQITRPILPPELARPYHSRPITTAEDRRSMFLAFSKDKPLISEHIVQYFIERWGNCIQAVVLEGTSPGVTPMYGRIVLTSDTLMGLILSGENPVKFVINGRPVWARTYK